MYTHMLPTSRPLTDAVAQLHRSIQPLNAILTCYCKDLGRIPFLSILKQTLTLISPKVCVAMRSNDVSQTFV
ncbi:hypothetical protein M378DRAFT_154602 [Amanita muscaria Koide BX008]|uniref:Uncharacterized protein n=1 Tax=Amanita muscaria (strain Koide BX008) TaxID=946122 RepID=A0A0C2X9S6_AMAMK|nr:hypothetical protein M378DRAFT_154602 [Amanita muscaria Koide BX008]